MSLPTDRDARNALPVWDGCLMYFPDVWAEIAKVSAAGNKQHALGGKLRWERGVSTDHENKVLRHMLDHAAGNVLDTDATFHLAKAAWRILAALQLAIEATRLPPMNEHPDVTVTRRRIVDNAILDQRPEWAVPEKLQAAYPEFTASGDSTKTDR